MICSMCKKNQASIFSSKITPDGKREMEGLCINCAKKLGINTDEIAEPNTFAIQASISAFKCDYWVDSLREYVYENRRIIIKRVLV